MHAMNLRLPLGAETSISYLIQEKRRRGGHIKVARGFRKYDKGFDHPNRAD